MSNTYFNFKQFRIDQGQCAMKVSTDACIHGAWTPSLPDMKRILDIGAGTGLLSLMLAQRIPDATIDAVEIDSVCASQATANFEASTWTARLNVINTDIRNYTVPIPYDLIIANPPFFNNSLLGPESTRNTARHTTSLSYPDLLSAISRNLSPTGYASILLPCPENTQFCAVLAGMEFSECGRLSIRHTSDAEVKRVVTLISKIAPQAPQNEELIIKDAEQQYTPAFISLLAPFYLYL